MNDIFQEPLKGHGIKGLVSRLWYAVKRRFTRPEKLLEQTPNAEGLEFVILAAGKATRNYPHSKGLPHKSLAPFGSRKVIDEVIGQVLAAGGRHITIVVSSQDAIHAFESAFRREPDIEKKFEKKGDTARLELLKSLYIPDGVEIKYVVQAEPKGTGHATALAYGPIRETGRGVVMIWPDDVFLADHGAKYPEDRAPIYKRAVAKYLAGGGKGNMAITRRVKNPSRWGIIEDGRYVEKPDNAKGDHAACGFIIFDREVCEELLSEAKRLDAGQKVAGLVGGEHTFIPALNRAVDRDPKAMRIKVEAKRESDVYLDCGTTEGYEKALLYTLLTESRFARDNFKFTRKLLPRIDKNIKRDKDKDRDREKDSENNV
ncbi:MAG: hypothetical protein LBH41_02440 [Rickettsiales bacterium]|jgi:UTP-glucose-1-phosphate uridylyltransferase|nr:hypothetical protein [Rickettsiales bacterium]